MSAPCRAVTAVAICSLSFFSCSKTYNTGIYRTGRTWNFNVYFFDAHAAVQDSCTLLMTIGKGGWLSAIMDQRELKYTYGKCCGGAYTETTGVDERDNLVFIHPPRLACFSFTEIPPMPEISLPVNMTSVSTGELRVVKGYGHLNGKTIKSKYGPVKDSTFRFAGTAINCVLIKGGNTNYIDSLGQYRSEHLFNEHYGFVQMAYYKPNGESVLITLKSTNFR